MNITHKRFWKMSAVGILVLLPIAAFSYSYLHGGAPIDFSNKSTNAVCASLHKHYPPGSNAQLLRTALLKSGAGLRKGTTREGLERVAKEVYNRPLSLDYGPSTTLEVYSHERMLSPNPYMIVLAIGERDSLVDIVCY